MKVTSILTFLYLFLKQIASQQRKPWCYVQADKKATPNIDASQGGPNWGFCNLDSERHKEMLTYRIFVETPNISGAGANGKFSIQLFGEEGTTEDTLLTDSGFAQGSFVVKKILAGNIGDLVKIRLKNQGTESYMCKSVRVEIGAKFWDFDCDDVIACPKKCFQDMTISGNQRYVISVKTSNKPAAQCSSPVYIKITGTLGTTPKKILSESGFQKGSLDNIELFSKDVGSVFAVEVSVTNADTWIPESIVVKRGGKEEASFNPKGQFIICTLVCSIKISNPRPAPPSTGGGDAGGGGGGGGGGGDDHSDGGGSSAFGSGATSTEDGGKKGGGDSGGDDNAVGSDYAGGALTPAERNRLFQISCDAVVKQNQDLGIPDYTTNMVNFNVYLAICPNGCYRPSGSTVHGYGLHPEESSICKAAIVDNAMPYVGGVVAVAVLNGLEHYDGHGKVKGIKTQSHGKSKKSFFTYKVDNIDFAESDIRIVSSTGMVSSKGRLEFRVDGHWGTVCVKGMSPSAARMICRNLKYKDGVLKNPPPDEDQSGKYCTMFDGEDHCGPADMDIHFMKMACQGNENNIMSCYREMADNDCKHTDDAIIQCTNIDYDQPQDPEPGTIRLVDDNGAPSKSNAGRLEFYRGKWGTICNSKFTDKSAEVACRQMGYDIGKIIGKVNQNGVCTQYDGKNYCAKTDVKIFLKNVDCKGDEAKLAQCGGTDTVSGCSHEQDVIITCEGGGDPSGESQKKDNGLPPPPILGKLPLTPIIQASCQTNMKAAIFRGSVGSVFLVSCPSGCTNAEGTIWGTGIYTTDSAICRAAINAGVLQDLGGLIIVVKMPGQDKYEESKNRKIQSTKYAAWEESFTISRPNSLAIKLAKAFGAKKKSFIEESFTMNLKNPKLSALRLSTALIPVRQYSWGHHIYNFKNFVPISIVWQQPYTDSHSSSLVSFAEGGSSSPIFQWMPEFPGFVFDGSSTFVDTTKTMGQEFTGLLRVFSIAVKCKMYRPRKSEVTIVGHSGCGGYAFIIDQANELLFKVRCTDNEFHTGFYMPINFDISIVLTYDKTFASFYVDGTLFNTERKAFAFRNDKHLDIGAFSETKSQVFNGEIEYVQVYDHKISDAHISSLNAMGVRRRPKGLPLAIRLTVDGRKCITACTTNPKPGDPGAGMDPSMAALGMPGGGSDVGGPEGIQESSTSAIMMNINNGPQMAYDVRCDTTGLDMRFNGPTGKSFRLNCPKSCEDPKYKGNVFGTMIYYDESVICKAGIHDGKMKGSDGGHVLMIIANGEDRYLGSFQNDIQSVSFGAAARSLLFKVAAPIQRITCNDSAASAKFAGDKGAKFLVFCPPGCGKQPPSIFGNGIYTDDSSICQAAFHSGFMTDKGGEAQFEIEGPRQTYAGVKRNNLQSEKRGSYVRSMRMIGDGNACKNFEEKYDPPNIFEHWKMFDAKGALFGPSDWTFFSHPTAYGLAIKQNSLIQGTEFNYGTVMVHREFDCNDGIFNVNVFFVTLEGMALIYFRYFDPNNFYAIELNSNSAKKIRLVKKNEGVGEAIGGFNVKLLPQVWYRYQIVYVDTNIQVYLQVGQRRSINLMLNVTDDSIQRGAVGVGSQHSNTVFFDGIQTKSYSPKKGLFVAVKNVRIWDNCLVGSTPSHRKKYCKALFGGYEVSEFCSF